MNKRIALTVLTWILGISLAWASHTIDFVPIGQVQKIESAQAVFNDAMVPFGNAQNPAPFDMQCSDPSATGAGRWLDPHRWTYVFDSALSAGVRCTATLHDGVRSLSNQPITGPQTFEFSTGGPRVVDARPYDNIIDEDQVFVLRFNGDVDAQSLLAHSGCAVEGLGEEIPTRLITGRERVDILATLYSQEFDDSSSTQLLQCTRRLSQGAAVQLSVGPGVASVTNAGPGVISDGVDVFDYQVRPSFSASLVCGRESARAPCLPVMPIRVSFTSPIRAADAAQIRLDGPDQSYEPESLGSEDQRDVRYVRFPGPFPARTSLTLSLPDALNDDAERELVNADMFPLQFDTADYPPLVKFASNNFGIIERFAHVQPGRSHDAEPPTVPLTVRRVESALMTKDLRISTGNVNDHVTQDDRQALRWYARVRRLEQGRWTASQIAAILSDQKIDYNDRSTPIDVRGVSVLADQSGTESLKLPGMDAAGMRPFEVIGVPVPEPGLHVLEVSSPQLGQSLLDSDHPMFVRSTVLVTNLGVHLKRGRDDVLAWVTTLDDGQVVPDAKIHVLDCKGSSLARGSTDHNGLWHHVGQLQGPDYCEETGLSGLFVSARIPADHSQARGKADFSFVLSDWDDGIETWRFNLPSDNDPTPTRVTHTVLDRTLLRAGETLSMRHFLREQTREGLSSNVGEPFPDHVVIQHQGSGDRYSMPLHWEPTPSGGLSANDTYTLAKTAKLGIYSVYLSDKESNWYGETQFRVESFRLPVFEGSLQVLNATESSTLIAPEQVSLDIQLNYLSGGPASKLPITVSALSKKHAWLSFSDYDAYSFQPPRQDSSRSGESMNEPTVPDTASPLFLNKESVILDAQGGARFQLDAVPKVRNASQWLFEASFMDPNGEIQTISHSVPVWPAQVQAGIRTDRWFSSNGAAQAHVVALTPDGQARANIPLTVRAVRHVTYSTRKRLVGGFYSYDNRQETESLGAVCKGRSNSKGEFSCTFKPSQQGDIELIVTATDPQGRSSSASTSVWVSGDDALWFGGHDDDRIDVIPLRKEWKPGEVAEFQVRLPFQNATALVTVEREGVLYSQVQHIDGKEPVIRLPIQDTWAPNVYVSVLALRGRIRQLPWRSLLAENWRSPQTWHSVLSKAAQLMSGAGTTVDLAKPAFRFGVAAIRVSDERDRLQVQLDTQRKRYQVGEQALVDITVVNADGKPAANGTVTFAAVDQALLELSPNNTWDVLTAMRREHHYGVRTATAQMQVVGRRHYGRKALPAGGGGGKSPTRELLDTLLVWQPNITLDDQGRAQIVVQLNDVISRFTLVAIADHGADQFGTGTATITSTRDLQVLSGLPQQVRQDDHYQAQLTVRNTTDRNMTVQVTATPSADGVSTIELPRSFESELLSLTAGDAQTVHWPIQTTTGATLPEDLTINWNLSVQEIDAMHQPTDTGDALVVSQKVLPTIPVRIQQSTLLTLRPDAPSASLELSAPKNARHTENGAIAGGVRVTAGAGPDVTLSGLQQWFDFKSYAGLEPLASKAIGLQDAALWAEVVKALPDYLDDDGLARYYPGLQQGNEVLTAYLLTLSDEAQKLGLPFKIPTALRTSMAHGLQTFIEGQISRFRWTPVADRDVRKLIALDALSRHVKISSRLLDSLTLSPDQWPTSAVIDWLSIMSRLENHPERQSHLDRARQVLRARMMAHGTSLVFADSALNTSSWLMVSPSSNQAKLILATIDLPQWDADRAKLLTGLIQQQRHGSWQTSVANSLSALAIQAVERQRHADKPDGSLLIKRTSGEGLRTLPWSGPKDSGEAPRMTSFLTWAELSDDARGASDSAAKSVQASVVFEQDGRGSPWLTVSAAAAVVSKEPVSSGFTVTRQLEPLSQAVPGQWTQGDSYRVWLRVTARSPMTWVMFNDPIPAGGHVLGSGLGRDSQIDRLPADSSVDKLYQSPPAFVEQHPIAYQAYYDYLPAGETILSYAVRLNTPGTFFLTPVRVESIYEPDVYGELPLPDPIVVHASGAL